MRKLLPILFFSYLLSAANTVVTGTLVAPTGDLLDGSCTISLPNSVANGGYWETSTSIQVPFTKGNLRVSLLPTDTMVPPQQPYTATCTAWAQVVNGNRVAATSWGPNYWIVPTSATPVVVSDIAFATQGLALASLARSWVTLTNAQWLTLTNVQWTTGIR